MPATPPGAARRTPVKCATCCRHETPGGDEDAAGRHRPRGGQQLPLADLPRDFVVLARVAERAGHAAASRVEIDDGARRDAAEQRARRRHQAHRLLMAVPVQQHGRRPRPAGSGESVPPATPARRSPRTARTRRRRSARGAARRRAAAPARLRGPPTGSSARGTRSRSPRVAASNSASAFTCAAPRASSSSPCEISGRPQQPCGCEAHADSRRLEDLGGGHADFRMVVVRERVVEEDDAGGLRIAAGGFA